MPDLLVTDVEYHHDGTRMLGYACAPPSEENNALPAVLLLHDAFGVSEDMIGIAHRLAALGHPVLIADLWGERTLPASEPEIGPLIGGMVRDRERWLARVTAAHRALAEQPWAPGRPVVLLGYCFGGSSALEYLRTGAEVAGVLSVHGGLDLLADGWSAARPTRVLICTGADDPMATSGMRTQLESALRESGMEWQTHLYSDTRHAFTSPKAAFSPMPEVVAYNPVSAARAWQATLHFLREVDDLGPVS